MTETIATQRGREQADAIRPFRVNVSEAELTELRRRINAEFHHRDRWARHSFHSRSFET